MLLKTRANYDIESQEAEPNSLGNKKINILSTKAF